MLEMDGMEMLLDDSFTGLILLDRGNEDLQVFYNIGGEDALEMVGEIFHPVQGGGKEFHGSSGTILCQPVEAATELDECPVEFAFILQCFPPGSLKIFVSLVEVLPVERLQPLHDFFR